MKLKNEIGKGRAVDDLDGRQKHVIVKALAIALQAVSAVPERRQPASDRADMAQLFKSMTSPTERVLYKREVRWLLEGGVR